jgi:hypothetical protein
MTKGWVDDTPGMADTHPTNSSGELQSLFAPPDEYPSRCAELIGKWSR